MASPTLASIQAEGLARLSETANTPAPEPTPAPPAQEATPAAEPAVSVAPPSPDAPQTESPSPAVSSAFAVSDPAALRFIEMHGGDPSNPSTWEAALKKGLEYNNRLSELSREPEPVAEPVPPVAVDPGEVQGFVERLLQQDAECKTFVSQFNEAEAGIKRLQDPNVQDSIPFLQKQIQIAQLRLEIPEVKADSFQAEDLRAFIRNSQLDIRDKKAEIREYQDAKREADQGFRGKVDYYNKGVEERLREKLTNEREQTQYDTDYQSAFEQTPQLFQDAFTKAVTKHNISDTSKEDFRQWCKDQSILTASREAIKDWDGFVDKQAPAFLGMVDRNHRAKSAEHARAAHERAAQPGPALSTPAPSAAPVATQRVDRQTLERGGMARLKAMLTGSA